MESRYQNRTISVWFLVAGNLADIHRVFVPLVDGNWLIMLLPGDGPLYCFTGTKMGSAILFSSAGLWFCCFDPRGQSSVSLCQVTFRDASLALCMVQMLYFPWIWASGAVQGTHISGIGEKIWREHMVCNDTCTIFAERKLVPMQFQSLSDGLYSPVSLIHQEIGPLFMETLTFMRLSMGALTGHSTGDVGHNPTVGFHHWRRRVHPWHFPQKSYIFISEPRNSWSQSIVRVYPSQYAEGFPFRDTICGPPLLLGSWLWRFGGMPPECFLGEYKHALVLCALRGW